MQETRQFGFKETLLQGFHDQLQGTSILVTTARLKGNISPSLLTEKCGLTQALQWIQQRHPLLRATVKDETDYFSFAVDEKPKYLPLSFIDRKSDVHWKSVVESELTHLFPHDRYQWRMTVLPHTRGHLQEIILTCNHNISDGISVTNFFHELFSNLSKKTPVFSKSLKLLPPVDACNPCRENELLADGITLAKRHRHPIKETLKNPSPLTTWSYYKTAPLEKRKVKNIYQCLEKKDLIKLKTQCKEEKTSINAVLNAAVLLAAQEMADSPIDTTLHTPINYRPFCSPSIPKDYFGLYASMVSTYHHVEQTSSLWDLARDYSHQLKIKILLLQNAAAPGKIIANSSMKKEAQKAISMRLGSSPTTYPNGFVVTNLGHLPYPKNYGSLDWDSLFFSTCRQAGEFVIMLHANTLHHQLMCCFTYTQPLITKDKATRFSETVIQLLLKEILCQR